MNPILSRRGWLLLYLAAWLVLAGLLAAGAAFYGVIGWLEATLFALPMAFVYSFVCLASWYPVRSIPLATANPFRLIATHLVGASVSSILWVLAGQTWSSLLASLDAGGIAAASYSQLAPFLFGFGVLLFILSVVINYLFIAAEASRESEHKALELEVLAREAELRALKAQIHPHFLFNSLNSISALTTTDPAGAREMCVRLADFLRKTLNSSARKEITLDEELALAESFVSIEQVRFGSRLKFTTDVDRDAGSCVVPPLLLQPLLENAVGHGIASLVEGGEIVLAVRRQGTMINLSLVNSFDPGTKQRTRNGVGLDITRKRLEGTFGVQARLTTRQDGDLFTVGISMPAVSNAQPRERKDP
jgi:two-component system sensor histidine kinase AlgZ